MDENGFDSFCHDVSPGLVGSLRLQCGDQGRAEDAAQEALTRAWTNWPAVRSMESPRGWVFRVGFNLIIGASRGQAAEERAIAKVHRRHDIVVDELEADRATLERVLQDLAPRQRQVITLRFYADMSVNETAMAMSCAPGTVKALTNQALTRMRQRLDIEVPTKARTGDRDDSA